MKWFKFVLGSAIVVALATFTAVRFGGIETKRLRAEVDTLEQEKQRLVEYARRLDASRRVAQVDVIRQRTDDAGRTVSTLMWQEIGLDGTLGKPLALETIGDLVYFDALVIKFKQQLVGEGDPERGVSLALFRRVFGEQQAPDSGAEIGREARPVCSLTPNVAKFHDELWGRFWEIAENPKVAARYGVRVAQCEAPAARLKAGQIWEVALDAAGGLNIRRLKAALPGLRSDDAIQAIP